MKTRSQLDVEAAAAGLDEPEHLDEIEASIPAGVPSTQAPQRYISHELPQSQRQKLAAVRERTELLLALVKVSDAQLEVFGQLISNTFRVVRDYEADPTWSSRNEPEALVTARQKLQRARADDAAERARSQPTRNDYERARKLLTQLEDFERDYKPSDGDPQKLLTVRVLMGQLVGANGRGSVTNKGEITMISEPEARSYERRGFVEILWDKVQVFGGTR